MGFLASLIQPILAKSAVATVLATLALGLFTPMPTIAQSRQICSRDGNFEPASETLREVKLPSFGLVVSIPENYRTMQLQGGSVEILHPDDFEMLQCVARGGRGGHGFYSEAIRLVEDDLSMDLREQAAWTVGYSQGANGQREQIATSVRPYESNGLRGYIVTSVSDYSVSFLGTAPSSNKLIKITAGCDCEVEVENLTNLLSRVNLMQ